MQTISINFIVPQGWHELSDKQLRYVYQLLAQNFTSDEVKTLCLLHWTGTKVIGKQNTDGYLLRKGKFLFEVTPLTLAELLPNLDWLGSLPTSPIRPVKLKHRPGIAADFDEVPFEQYIIVDNLYQGYLQTQDDTLLDEIASVVYPGIKTPLAPRRAHRHFLLGSIAQILARKPIPRLLFWKPGNGRRKPACQFPIPNFPFSHRRCRERTNPCPHQRRCHKRGRSPRTRYPPRTYRVKCASP